MRTETPFQSGASIDRDKRLHRVKNETTSHTPLLDTPVKRDQHSMFSVAVLNPGDRATVCRIQATFPALRQRLMELGLITGTSIEVIRFAPFGDPMEIKVNGYRLSLRRKDARAIIVHMESP